MNYTTGINSNPYTRKTSVTWQDFLSKGEIKSAMNWFNMGYTCEFNTAGFAAYYKNELIEEMWEADFQAFVSKADIGTTERPPKSEHLRHKYASNIWKCFTVIRYHWLLHFSDVPAWVKVRKHLETQIQENQTEILGI